MSTVVEHVSESDLPELFEKFSKVYAFNPRLRERDYFDWQYAGAPDWRRGDKWGFLIERARDGAISGWIGYVPFQVRQNGALRDATYAMTWYSEKRQGGGLALFAEYSKIADIRFLLCFAEDSSVIFRASRIPILPALPRVWAATDADAVIDLFGMTDPGDRATVLRSAQSIRQISAAPAGHVERFADDVEFRLEDTWPEVNSYARRRGVDLNWRYVDIPRHDYRLLETETGMGVYRVQQIKGTDHAFARILEWTFHPPETASALSALLRTAQAAGAILIDFHCSARSLTSSLMPFGFLPQTATSVPLPDLFRPVHQSKGFNVALDLPPHRAPRSVDFDSWYITAGDSDIDRVKL